MTLDVKVNKNNETKGVVIFTLNVFMTFKETSFRK